MRVSRVELREVALPLLRPWETAGGVLAERRVLLVSVEGVDAIGWGEAAPIPGYSDESIDEAWGALTALTLPTTPTGPTPQSLNSALAPRGHPVASIPTAAAALEQAVWDFVGRIDAGPLWAALGGVGSRVPGGAVIPVRPSPEDVVGEVATAVEQGFRHVKVKIRPGRDVSVIAAVRQGFPELSIGVDANGAYGPDDLETLARLDEFGLAYLEQPFPRSDLATQSRLGDLAETPVCLDESVTSAAAAVALIEAGVAGAVTVKPSRLGVSGSRAVLEASTKAGVPARYGGMLESTVGRAHALAVATLPGFTLPGDLGPPARYLAADVASRLRLDDGDLVASAKAGIGVTPEPELLAAYTTRIAVID